MSRDPPFRLLPTEEKLLQAWGAENGGSGRRALRARVILALARGGSNREVARQTGVHPETVARWRRRFEANRTDGLLRDAPRVRVPRKASQALTDRIVRTTRETNPPEGGRWTTRSLGRALRVNHMVVHRVWQAHGLFSESAADRGENLPAADALEVVGAFFDAPAALVIELRPSGVARAGATVGDSSSPPVLSISGAHSVEAASRTPLGLLALLDQAHATLAPTSNPGRGLPHELLVFLRSVEESGDPRSIFHVFLDRAPAEAGVRAEAWFATHRRFRLHYPTVGESWTGLVEDWLRECAERWPVEDRIRTSARFNEALARAFFDRLSTDG